MTAQDVDADGDGIFATMDPDDTVPHAACTVVHEITDAGVSHAYTDFGGRVTGPDRATPDFEEDIVATYRWEVYRNGVVNGWEAWLFHGVDNSIRVPSAWTHNGGDFLMSIDGYSGNNQVVWATGYPIPAGEWTEITYSHSQTHQSIWINGVLAVGPTAIAGNFHDGRGVQPLLMGGGQQFHHTFYYPNANYRNLQYIPNCDMTGEVQVVGPEPEPEVCEEAVWVSSLGRWATPVANGNDVVFTRDFGDGNPPVDYYDLGLADDNPDLQCSS